MKEFKSLQDINLDVKNSFNNKGSNDKWILNYHFETPFGLINDPNGLSYYNGEYHLFFQWNPYSCEHKFKHWGLTKTKDFINFTVPKAVLAPNDPFDKNGCYSGSAFVYNDKLEILYTGNVKDDEGNRESYQVRAICDKEGNVTKVGPVVSKLPLGYTAHFRDPKIYKHDGKYYFVIGAQTEELKGRALLYSSLDFESWKYEGEIDTDYKDFGFMWECPGILTIDNRDILIFSPQGLEKEEFKYQNIYQSGYMVGNLDYKTLKFNHGEFKELDMGFDFYAPQCFEDNKGRQILIGWMGLPEEETYHPTNKNNRSQCLTIPRELSLINDVLYQKPLEELKILRTEEILNTKNQLGKCFNLNEIKNNSYELLIELEKHNSNEIELRFAEGTDEYMAFSYNFNTKVAILDRSNMNEGLKGIRKFKLESEEGLKLHMFMDNSAMELYMQDGMEVASARIYPEEGSFNVKLLSKDGDMKVKRIKAWNLKGVNYNE